ncbi:unnamed protein product [Ectocarpus fasciculatus]
MLRNATTQVAPFLRKIGQTHGKMNQSTRNIDTQQDNAAVVISHEQNPPQETLRMYRRVPLTCAARVDYTPRSRPKPFGTPPKKQMYFGQRTATLLVRFVDWSVENSQRLRHRLRQHLSNQTRSQTLPSTTDSTHGPLVEKTKIVINNT